MCPTLIKDIAGFNNSVRILVNMSLLLHLHMLTNADYWWIEIYLQGEISFLSGLSLDYSKNTHP